jgi:hypothetical protein
LGRLFRKIVLFMLLGAIALGGAAWGADWLWWRHKTDADAYGAIEVHHRFAVKLKNRRIEERSERPHPEECVHSLFPHEGDDPCWYVARHRDDVEEIDSGQWHFYNQ